MSTLHSLDTGTRTVFLPAPTPKTSSQLSQSSHEDPRLLSIIHAWSELPEGIQIAISALVAIGKRLPDTRVESRILTLLRENPAPMTRKQIAMRLGLEGPKGRFGEHVRSLIKAGLIIEHAGEVTDDPAKFLVSTTEEHP